MSLQVLLSRLLLLLLFGINYANLLCRSGSQWVQWIISTVLDTCNRRVTVNIDRCYRCEVHKLLQNLSLLLTWSFCPLDSRAYGFIREANFRFFTNWCIIIPSSLFSLFRTESTEISVVHVYLWLNGIKPYTKYAWINNADHRRSQPICGIHIAKISVTSLINMPPESYWLVKQRVLLFNVFNI